MKYKILASEGKARRVHIETVHGNIETPVSMNVGTVAAIKGAVSTNDLKEVGTQVQLSNIYHLHVCPGDGKVSGNRLIYEFGGPHHFIHWDRPILTDSSDFWTFSLSGTREVREEGVTLHSHIDDRKIFMRPEKNMQIQLNLGSAIAIVFDECPPSLAERSYIEQNIDRIACWLKHCKTEMARLNTLPDRVNPEQFLLGINQGSILEDVCICHARETGEPDLNGYTVGGLAVGESAGEMYRILDAVVSELPCERPTYLMGVGMPQNILKVVECGVGFFDCVYPSRNGRHGHAYTDSDRVNLFNEKYELDPRPIKEDCGCPACYSYFRAYTRHPLKAGETLEMRLCALYNLYFYDTMMQEIRDAIKKGESRTYKERKIEGMETKT